MKKVLHLQLLPILSGVQNFSIHLLDGLPLDEYEITIASAGGGPLVEVCRERGWKHISIKGLRHAIGPLDLISYVHLMWIFKRGKYDIVHSNSSKPGLLGRLAARMMKVPLILHTSHGNPFQKGQHPLTYGLYLLLDKISNRLGDTTIYVNNSDREQALKLGLIPGPKAITIYNAIPPLLEDRLRQIGQMRQSKIKTAEDEIIIGSTMRFSEQKNAIQLILSACKACLRNDRLKFIILGNGEHFFLCRQLIRSYKLSTRIILPGWDNEIAPWLQKFDAFILFSRWEAQPFSIIEAMHAGLPVIGSNIASIAELVDAQTGYLIPLNKPKQLEDLLVELAVDFGPAYAKGLNAMRVVQNKCDYQSMVQSYLAVYNGAEKLAGK